MPHYIRLASRRPFTFAGLWSLWRSLSGEPLESCAIVTGPPSEEVARLHDRMPVILPAEARDEWLDPGQRDEAALGRLLDRVPPTPFAIHAVSRHVNSPEHDDPLCIEPLGAIPAPEPPPALSARRRRRPRPEEPDLFGGSGSR
jgi:putative SOS response-associated peptidase YedK